LNEIAEAEEPVRWDFFELLEHLVEDPFPETSSAHGIMPFEGVEYDVPASGRIRPGWTVPFDDGLLLYQALKDYPRIYLIDVLWAYSEA
jgi:hypothetical protein